MPKPQSTHEFIVKISHHVVVATKAKDSVEKALIAKPVKMKANQISLLQ